MKIIVISGLADHGKDAAAQEIKYELEEQGARVLITHYADLLKYICKAFFGWNGKKNEYGRELLQYVGTDIIRAKKPNFWVDFLTDVLGLFSEEWDYVLVPDCRFPNEIDCFKTALGVPTTHLRIVRHNFVSSLTQEQLSHSSETALNDVAPDYTIFNDGTLEDLAKNVRLFLADYLSETF